MLITFTPRSFLVNVLNCEHLFLASLKIIAVFNKKIKIIVIIILIIIIIIIVREREREREREKERKKERKRKWFIYFNW